jgi:protein subunit release factor B
MHAPVDIPDSDDALLGQCEVQTFRAGGPGGQHQNVTDSAVRLRHRPTGVTVVSRAQRSQHLNKLDALRRLRRKLEKLNEPQPAPRKETHPSRADTEQRIAEKKTRGVVKRLRRPPAADDE